MSAGGPEPDRGHEADRRDGVAEDRDTAAHERDGAGDRRDDAAGARDLASGRRDDAALQRDAAADRRDARAVRRERAGKPGDPVPPAGSTQAARAAAARDRRRASQDRDAAADERKDSEQDRRTSHADRRSGADERGRAGNDRDASARDRRHASLDDLTGAYLRGAGLLQLEREVLRAARTSEPLTLAFLDVDHLKAVNDSAGHAAGDRLLARVAAALRDRLRAYDLVIRYGGDEFVCVLAGTGPVEVAERFRLVHEDLRPFGSVSVGLATLRPDESPAALVARADAALYAQRATDRTSPA